MKRIYLPGRFPASNFFTQPAGVVFYKAFCIFYNLVFFCPFQNRKDYTAPAYRNHTNNSIKRPQHQRLEGVSVFVDSCPVLIFLILISRNKNKRPKTQTRPFIFPLCFNGTSVNAVRAPDMNQKKQKAYGCLSQSPGKLNQKVNKSFHDFSINQEFCLRNRQNGKLYKF